MKLSKLLPEIYMHIIKEKCEICHSRGKYMIFERKLLSVFQTFNKWALLKKKKNGQAFHYQSAI